MSAHFAFCSPDNRAARRRTVFATAGFALLSIALLGALPLWLDEILQLIETRGTSTSQMLARLPRNSGAAPLGYLVQQYGLKITGYGVRRARLTSALFGIAAVFCIGVLAVAYGLTLAAAIYTQPTRLASVSHI